MSRIFSRILPSIFFFLITVQTALSIELNDQYKNDNSSTSNVSVYQKNRQSNWETNKYIIVQNPNAIALAESISKKKVKIAIMDTNISYEADELKHLKADVYQDQTLNYNPHGTAMLSIIAGQNLGINPNVDVVSMDLYTSKLLAVNSNAANWEKLLKLRPQLVNYSSGGNGTYDAKEYEVLKIYERLEIPIIVAAGNEGKINSDYYPCKYNLPNIICVGNVLPDGKISRSSNSGSMVYIYAYGTSLTQAGPIKGYTYANGTSQATAYVSGVVSMMLQINPALKVSQIKSILAETANINPDFKNESQVPGYVNFEKAIAETFHGINKVWNYDQKSKVSIQERLVQKLFEKDIDTKAERSISSIIPKK